MRWGQNRPLVCPMSDSAEALATCGACFQQPLVDFLVSASQSAESLKLKLRPSCYKKKRLMHPIEVLIHHHGIREVEAVHIFWWSIVQHVPQRSHVQVAQALRDEVIAVCKHSRLTHSITNLLKDYNAWRTVSRACYMPSPWTAPSSLHVHFDVCHVSFYPFSQYFPDLWRHVEDPTCAVVMTAFHPGTPDWHILAVWSAPWTNTTEY